MTEGSYLLKRIRARCIDDAGCWVWQGTCQKGVMPMINVGGSIVSVRRVVFTELNGPVKPGHEITVSCETARCVRCVEEVTYAERRRRMAVKRNTDSYPRLIPPHAKLSAEKAREIRASDEPTAVLAERYGVSKASIGYVKIGKTWAPPSPWDGLGARS
ncbi:hypothetical protein [Variovorax sp. JS1663]|uniref:hypothetical protein n=1 Tax=Variovorax sp. JS1663 TaxID=1851577 RepID=UPI000B344DDF|nr:hypothetical protein [Variovorax sp. JS1663]OUM00560.1 hypothetical protein A8M77_21065 [Variovorax sp. JS1663]